MKTLDVEGTSNFEIINSLDDNFMRVILKDKAWYDIIKIHLNPSHIPLANLSLWNHDNISSLLIMSVGTFCKNVERCLWIQTMSK